MAFDFPSSPTDGQQFQAGGYAYTYSAATSGWVLTSTGGVQGPVGPQGPAGPTGPAGASGGATIADTAPGSPTPGQLWWCSADGNLYVYYDDGTTQQWVQINTVGT